MSFTRFEQAIKTPALRCVARHWNEARGARAMPDWSDIRPSAIPRQLPIIWSYRYDRGRDAFIGRIAGDQVEKVFGKTFRSTPMEELYPPDRYPVMLARFRRIVCEPALYLEEGKVFELVHHFGFGERIAMPLSHDGVTSDGILGATLYEAFQATDAAPPSNCEQWFSLAESMVGAKRVAER